MTIATRIVLESGTDRTPPVHPVPTRPPRAKPRRARPARWVPRLLLAAVTVLLAAAVPIGLHGSTQPHSLANSHLTGPRLVTGPVCVEEAVQVSTAMRGVQRQRERAEAMMFDFTRRELAGTTSYFSAAFFAGSATLASAPIPVATLTGPPAAPDDPDRSGATLAPAIDALVAARAAAAPGYACAARALIVVTDGRITDPESTGAALRRGLYARVFAVIPSATGWGRPGPLAGRGLDPITVYHFAVPGLAGFAATMLAGALPLDVVFGDVLGALTGQRLVPAQ